MRRNFLFLQGCTCPFFNVLGSKLRDRGHSTGRINFNVGDYILWYGGVEWNFRKSADEFSSFIQDVIVQNNFTDVIMLGDTRPIHKAALDVANRLGLITHILEEGYFRPGWLTLERQGINGNSRLPKDAKWYQEVAPHINQEIAYQKVFNSISLLALWEITYHLPNLLNPVLYSGYRTHRPAISGVEFSGWAWRFSKLPFYARRDAAKIEEVVAKYPFFLFPLQLDGDSQLTYHSSFENIAEAIRTVLLSFADHAPSDSRLIIKNHPLDTGLTDYGRVVRLCSRELDLEDRVVYLETGSLNDLLSHAMGIVTVNSTVGTAALAAGCPVMVLGEAVYDVEGLTFQGDLDAFWSEPQPPDTLLFNDFSKVVIHTTQVNGGFYSKSGCVLAVENAMRFIEPHKSPLEEFLS